MCSLTTVKDFRRFAFAVFVLLTNSYTVDRVHAAMPSKRPARVAVTVSKTFWGIGRFQVGRHAITLTLDQKLSEGPVLIPGNDGLAASVKTLAIKVGDEFSITDRHHLGSTYRLLKTEKTCALLDEKNWSEFSGVKAVSGRSRTVRICSYGRATP
jgi:hypothetical protein